MLDPRTQRRQRMRNAAQEALELGCLLAVVAGLAWLLFGTSGLIWLLAAGALGIALRPRIPTRAALTFFRAQPMPATVLPELHRAVRVLAARAELDHTPGLYYVPSPVPNAFSLGRGADSSLAVTDGLLHILTLREAAGVVAHEISHLRAGDTLVMSLSEAMSRFARTLAWIGLLAMLVGLPFAVGGAPQLLTLAALLVALPVVVTALQSAFSRSREYDADLGAARLTGDPEGLASALEQLDRSTGRLWERLLVPDGRAPAPWILQTHPPTEERTRRLRALAAGSPTAIRRPGQPRL